MFLRACRTTLKRTSGARATARFTLRPQMQRFFSAEPSEAELKETEQKLSEIQGTSRDVIGDQAAAVAAADMYETRSASKLPLVGDFGTLEAPCLVPSRYPSRIVGCTGGGPHGRHELVWMDIRQGPKHVCKECGQVFQLAPWSEDMEPLDAEADPKDL